MGIVQRQSIPSTIATYIGIIVGYFNYVWLFPNILSAEQFGLIQVLLSAAMIFSKFSLLGSPQIMIRYFPYYKDDIKENNAFLGFTISLALAGFLLFSGIFYLFNDLILKLYQEKSLLFVEEYFYFIPLALFIILFEVLYAYCRSNLRNIVPSIIKEVILRILLAGIILIYYFQLISFQTLLLLFVSAYGGQVILILFYARSIKKLQLKLGSKFFKGVLFKKLFQYGVFSFLSTAAFILVSRIDIMMLGAMTGLTETAIYAVAFYVGTVIQVPARNIFAVASPIIANAWKNHDLEKINELYKKTALNQFIIGALLLIGIWANIHNLFAFLPDQYAGGKYVILFIGLGKLFDISCGVNGGIITTSRYYKFNLWVSILLIILTILTNLWLIPIYGIVGAAMATALSIIIFNSVKLLFVWIKLRLQPYRFSFFIALLVALIVLLIGIYLPKHTNVIIDLLYRSSLMTIVYILLIYYLKISEDINNLIRSAYHRVF